VRTSAEWACRRTAQIQKKFFQIKAQAKKCGGWVFRLRLALPEENENWRREFANSEYHVQDTRRYDNIQRITRLAKRGHSGSLVKTRA